MIIDRKQLTAMVEKVPAFPESVHQVLELTASPDCPPKKIVAVIEHDPVLTMSLLKTVNSAYFGLSKQIAGVKQAVVYVGLNTVKNVAIMVATTGALPKTNKAGLDTKTLWLHSLRVGVIAKLVAKTKGVSANNLASYFVGGLLHDIGKILYARFLPDQYQQVVKLHQTEQLPLYEAEQRILGLGHCELGAMVAQKWKLPLELIDSIRSHHHIEAQTNSHPLSLAIFFANIAAHALEETEAVSDQAEIALSVPQVVLNYLGCSADKMLVSLNNLDEEVEKAKTFIQGI